ncbi:MAG: GNAT family N-acetyltransferase [Gemmatimonadaceae bacterium]
MSLDISFRMARLDEVDALNALIHASAEVLSRGFYRDEELEAANRYVFGIDTTLIRDGTYYVAEADTTLVACGGWSRRGALYGGDQRPMADAPRLDPTRDAARIRAFFVHPEWARRGIGRHLLELCTSAARAEGYRSLELMSTLPGVPLYAACGFVAVESVRDRMPNGIDVPFVRMRKELAGADAVAPSPPPG